MPILPDDDTPVTGFAPQLAEPAPVTPPVPPFSRLFDAAMRRENIVGSAAEAFAQRPMSPFSPSFDPFADIKGYEDYAGSFIGANSEDDVLAIKSRIDTERRRADLLEQGGLLGMVAGGTASLLDPTTLLPVGGQFVAVTRTGRALAGAARLGAASGIGAAAQETGLQATQLTRPVGESALNVAGATVIGSVLGGAVGALGRPLTRELAESVMRAGDVYERELSGLGGVARGFGEEMPAGGSASAAAVRDTTLGQETFEGTFGAANALSFSSPTLRLGTSPSVETRRFAQELADQPLSYRKNVEGIETPHSVESVIRQAQAPLAEALVDPDDLFVRYRTGEQRGLGDITKIAAGDMIRGPGNKLSYDQFAEEVGRAMRRGDASDIPEVAQAARRLREKVFDPLKERAIAAGLLPEDVSVDTALSYLTRVYDTPKIVARRPEFERILTDWLTGAKNEVADRVAEMQTKLSSLTSRRERAEIDLFGKKQRFSEVAPEAEQTAKKFAALDRRLKLADREFRRLAAEQQAAERRLREFAPTPDLEKDDPLRRALRDLRRGTNRQPETLIQFLRRTGGIQDEGGELKLMDLHKVRRLVREDGAPLDDATHRAWEAGFFPDHNERPLVNDLLDALMRESHGMPQYSAKDADALAYHDYLNELRIELGQRGIDLNRPDAEIATLLTDGDDARFRANTPAARAKAREIDFNARRAARAADAAAQRVREVQAEWDKVRPISHDTASETAALKGEIAALEKELSRIKPREEKLTSAIDAQHVFAGLEDIDLQDIARQITDTLTHAAPDRANYLPIPLSRGPLRERTLSIPDAAIEDFLDSDVRRIARMYTRTMASDTALTERFGRADMQDQLDKVREHYAVLREGITDEKKQKALDAAMKRDLRDIAAVRDRIRGTYGLPEAPNGLVNRAYHVIRDLNYLRLLGGMTVSAFPDLGRAVMVHGMMRVAGDGIVPMLRDFRQFRLAANEAKLAGTALDMVLDTRSMAMADMLDDYGRWSKYERGVKAMAEKFGLVTLMAPWNAGIKQFVGVVSQTRALQAIEKWAAGALPEGAERTRLASLGINQQMAERIDAMFRAHGEKRNGIWWANTAAWEDRGATETFRSALSKEIDTAIVTPGQERPLWATGKWGNTGRMIGQFRSFSIASTQRVLLTGLQRRDMATLNGALLMTGLGMLSYYAKHAMSGDPDKKPLPDPTTAGGVGQWLREGVDRAGLTGWLFDAHNILEKATRGSVGISRLTGEPPLSRYASRSVLEALLGPSAGIVESTARAAAAVGTGEWNKSDVTAIRRMIPLQNALGFRHLFDAAEEGLQRSLGVH